MLNVLKMDIYRMFRMKSLYVIWLVMVFCVVFTTSLAKTDYDAMQKDYEQGVEISDEDGVTNFGMNITLPTQPGEKTTVFDGMFANMRGKFVALFIVIFAVLFTAADTNSGYIKNIAGQVRNRYSMVLSKAVGLFLYTAATLGVFMLFIMLSNQIFFGYIEWGDLKAFGAYMGAQLLLNYALALICMAFTIITRSSVFSMMVSVCLCMNVTTILYSMLDVVIKKIGFDDVHIIPNTVTGKISLLSMEMTQKECIQSVVIAAAFGIVVILLSSIVFEKRDIG